MFNDSTLYTDEMFDDFNNWQTHSFPAPTPLMKKLNWDHTVPVFLKELQMFFSLPTT